MQSVLLVSDHKSHSVGYGSKVSLVFKAFEVLFHVPPRGQYGTWAMVYTVVLFSEHLLCWFGSVLYMHRLGRSLRFHTHLKDDTFLYFPLCLISPMPSGPEECLFLVFWLDCCVLYSLYPHILFMTGSVWGEIGWSVSQIQINMRKEKKVTSLEHRRPLSHFPSYSVQNERFLFVWALGA